METGLLGYIDANSAYELLQSGTALLIIDIRPVEEYDRGHISHAVNLTWRMIDELNTMGWEREPACLVVGEAAEDIGRAARALTLLGFRSVVLSGGMGSWQSLGLPVVQSSARGKFCCGRGCGCR